MPLTVSRLVFLGCCGEVEVWWFAVGWVSGIGDGVTRAPAGMCPPPAGLLCSAHPGFYCQCPHVFAPACVFLPIPLSLLYLGPGKLTSPLWSKRRFVSWPPPPRRPPWPGRPTSWLPTSPPSDQLQPHPPPLHLTEVHPQLLSLNRVHPPSLLPSLSSPSPTTRHCQWWRAPAPYDCRTVPPQSHLAG